MADDQARAEALDEDRVGDLEDFPPDRPLGATSYGTTAQEERVDEPIGERRGREVPEHPERAGGPDRPLALLDNTADADPGGAGAEEIDGDESGDWMEGRSAEADVGPFADTDDPVAPAAEEAAMHVVEEP